MVAAKLHEFGIAGKPRYFTTLYRFELARRVG